MVKNYPKLHFYDFVYLQYFAEKKNYRLTSGFNSIIKKVPFHVSSKYFNGITKSREMITKLLNSINFLIIKNKFENNIKVRNNRKNEKMDK